MDTVVVAMRCGATGAPLRVVFARRSGGSQYGIVAIEPGTGITVAVAPAGALPAPAGSEQPSPMTEERVPRSALVWGGFRCPICAQRGGLVYTCPSCSTLLCDKAGRSGRFHCPFCQYRHNPRNGWLRPRSAIVRRLFGRRSAADVTVSRFSGEGAPHPTKPSTIAELPEGGNRMPDDPRD